MKNKSFVNVVLSLLGYDAFHMCQHYKYIIYESIWIVTFLIRSRRNNARFHNSFVWPSEPLNPLCSDQHSEMFGNSSCGIKYVLASPSLFISYKSPKQERHLWKLQLNGLKGRKRKTDKIRLLWWRLSLFHWVFGACKLTLRPDTSENSIKILTKWSCVLGWRSSVLGSWPRPW